MDPETWEFTTDLDLTPFPIRAADFDRDGQLFVSTYLKDSLDNDYAALAVLNPASGEVSDLRYFDLDGSPFEDQEFALTVWGNVPDEPVLPATGAGMRCRTVSGRRCCWWWAARSCSWQQRRHVIVEALGPEMRGPEECRRDSASITCQSVCPAWAVLCGL